MSSEELPERVSVTMMARRLKMSRQRLHQLLGTTFPHPSRDEDGRPYFDREQQMQILDCYRNNRGLDGKTVFFRPRREKDSPKEAEDKSRAKPKRPAPQPTRKHLDLLKTMRGMGLSQAKASDLEEALRDLYPDGISEITEQVVRGVFLRLHSRLSE